MLVSALVFTGRVVDSDGGPVEGATVELRDTRGGAEDAEGVPYATSVRSGPDGTFALDVERLSAGEGGLPPGEYALSIRAAGRVVRTVAVEVARDELTIRWRALTPDGEKTRTEHLRLENVKRFDLGDLELKSYGYGLVVTLLGVGGVFVILAVLIGFLRLSGVVLRRVADKSSGGGA